MQQSAKTELSVNAAEQIVGEYPRTPPTVTLGKRKKKNWFMPGMMTAQIIPITHTRKEDTGMLGSSVLATAERTSG